MPDSVGSSPTPAIEYNVKWRFVMVANENGKKKGRPIKDPPEKMFFGIICTEAERDAIYTKINAYKIQTGKQVTNSEYFLAALGIR